MIIQTWPFNDGGDEKTHFYGEIAAVLPFTFKGIKTLPTELEYDSQN